MIPTEIWSDYPFKNILYRTLFEKIQNFRTIYEIRLIFDASPKFKAHSEALNPMCVSEKRFQSLKLQRFKSLRKGLMTAALVTPAQIFREASIVTTAKTDMKNSAIVASQRQCLKNSNIGSLHRTYTFWNPWVTLFCFIGGAKTVLKKVQKGCKTGRKRPSTTDMNYSN